jgi:O-acetyl-ADP-ribose deacetylase (regulator of RNase III)
MSDEMRVKNTRLRLLKADITDLEIESFVFYAQPSLELGSGFGNAISMRGGPSIQEELRKRGGGLETTQVITTKAGEMKAGNIIHAVGPRFQETDTEKKLQLTVENSLKEAERNGFRAVAFPAMGAGFYGVPLETSAKITLGTIQKYLNGGSKIEEVVVCLLDNREYQPFKTTLSALASV